jgi:hypothetical protein
MTVPAGKELAGPTCIAPTLCQGPLAEHRTDRAQAQKVCMARELLAWPFESIFAYKLKDARLDSYTNMQRLLRQPRIGACASCTAVASMSRYYGVMHEVFLNGSCQAFNRTPPSTNSLGNEPLLIASIECKVRNDARTIRICLHRCRISELSFGRFHNHQCFAGSRCVPLVDKKCSLKTPPCVASVQTGGNSLAKAPLLSI